LIGFAAKPPNVVAHCALEVGADFVVTAIAGDLLSALLGPAESKTCRA
jgi:hypothetical protein